ncbi:BON domain-containing protein [Sphingobacterium griseoflavum]|uniref:BON domain-containing protein n=1 Tax=Sphingobacterium griseoflavum TaxID=1474952 RepID=A0ABQ3HSR8_9SPHI|nr:BON domain-containing protein [Sphingobacterium griseoflavum]GHE23212.1 hypothetical protein GCM10017764_01800 [Sphingobacterium griseoflavum]
MANQIKSLVRNLVFFFGLLVAFESCKPHVADADVKAKVESVVAAHPNVVVSVKRGKVTLSGIVETEEDRRNLAVAAKDADPQNVKEVVDDLTVATLPVDSVHTDAQLKEEVQALTKKFPEVKAHVSAGVIRVSGAVEPNDVEKVKFGFEQMNAKELDMSSLKIKEKKP